ncbi:MAG: NAD(+)/NADH kinase, partial [Deltaproteobacteria bacterium]|nr:NAD(+)/NADH kinase [Deltaproteobacteria bacterium]
LRGKGAPRLGVNLGGLGFLTVIRVGEMYHMLERMLSGSFETEERMMLSVRLIRKKRRVSSWNVLNDAVIKGLSARLIRLETSINREHVTTYRADGLIVATPTGSTAYALSAHGPILYPTIHSIIVAPVCPFNLTNRPVVIPDWMSVEVTVRKTSVPVFLVLDGQMDIRLGDNDTVEIKRARQSVYLVKYEGKSYFDILRERLMWES